MDDMMKVENANGRVLVAGCACIVFSKLTPDQIRQFKTYHPEALMMNDKDTGEPLFALDLDEDEPGCLNRYGATFSKVTSADGKATITIVLDPAADDPVELVRNRLARPLMLLDEIEQHLLELLPELETEQNAVSGMIRQA